MRSMLPKECCEAAMRKPGIALIMGVLLAGGAFTILITVRSQEVR